MKQDQRELEAAIDAIAARLSGIEQRLTRLESSSRYTAPEADFVPTIDRDGGAESSGLLESLPLLGRTLLVLGGGFILRGITEGRLVGREAGTAMGIVYALLWLLFADRAAASGKRSSAVFHGLATAIIAFPLVWEGTVKFGVLAPATAAGVLGLIAAAALVAASRQKLASLAWVMTLGSVATALALAVSTRALVPFATIVVILGLATLWLEDRHGARGLALTVAAAADATLLFMTLVQLVGGSNPKTAQLMSIGGLISLQLALVVIYIGTLVYRTFSRRADLTLLEIGQGLAALLVGLGGADAISRSSGVLATPIGVTSLALAAGCYGASFSFIDRQEGHRRNFIFFSTVALLMVLAGFGVLLRDAVSAIAFAIAGVIAAAIGAWRARATLSLHGAVYVTVAALISGEVSGAIRELIQTPPPDAKWITLGVWTVVAAAVVLCSLPVAQHGRTLGQYSRVPKLVVLTVLAIGAAGVVGTFGSALLPRQADARIDPALLAVFRTAVLAIAAVALALIARWPRLPEAGWLAYPALIAGGLKLVFEDFRAGRPATLVVSLALYGGALIVTSKLIRKPLPDTPAPR